MGFTRVSSLLCICLPLLHFSLASSDRDENVRQACSVTRYVDLCVLSLSPYSKTAKTNHTAWARVGVSVALSEIKNTTRFLEKMKNSNNITARLNRQAISDCVECFHEAVDNVRHSLGVLRELDKLTFSEQIADVTTWVSAALTDEDTCLDGLDEERGRKRSKQGKRQRARKMVMDRVRNSTYVTSNQGRIQGGARGGRCPCSEQLAITDIT